MVPPVTDPTQPSDTPAFLNHERPPVPDLVVPRGVLPFHLEDRPVRGRLVKLGALADALLGRHAQHPAVLRLLGEALALTAALATALKFKGSFSLQAKGDGPVTLLLVDCTDGGALRGTAKVDVPRLEALLATHPQPSAAMLLGKGYFAFTCDQGDDMERYQGIVAIEGETLAEMTDTYFQTSEQLRTEVRLACGRSLAGWRATALVIERVAAQGGIPGDQTEEEQDDAWRTAQALVGTLKAEEMLDDALPAERLLHRLFHAEGLATDRPRALSYGCRCSRARLATVLENFTPDDLDHMAETGAITMTCDFCAVEFRFERDEVGGKAGRA
ncbi:Hsp33 family molecular chaperone HslO [Roseomonas sp. F4]